MRLFVALMMALPVLFGGCVGGLAAVQAPQRPPSGCGGPAALVVNASGVTSVAGYSGEQLVNAALVINGGQALGLPLQAQLIAVMTAMGESGLRVLDYGDAAGPDSRGLFQQRSNGAWGSYADRMDPTISARNFYAALIRVDGWQTLPPTIAAHRTQRNADPFHYERYWPAAVQVVEALSGASVTSGGGGDVTSAACAPAPSGAAAATGWIKPAVGPVTSGFGYRIHPITGVRKFHAGIDIGAPCRAPIYAAAAGVVISAGPASGYGNLIAVDHGGGIVTRYGHMYNDGLLVRVGDRVGAGQQIARIGSFGLSTGCHLHFEVMQDGAFVDPSSVLAAQGVPA